MRKNISVSPAYSPSPLGPSMNTAVKAQSQTPSSENKTIYSFVIRCKISQLKNVLKIYECHFSSAPIHICCYVSPIKKCFY